MLKETQDLLEQREEEIIELSLQLEGLQNEYQWLSEDFDHTNEWGQNQAHIADQFAQEIYQADEAGVIIQGQLETLQEENNAAAVLGVQLLYKKEILTEELENLNQAYQESRAEVQTLREQVERLREPPYVLESIIHSPNSPSYISSSPNWN